MLQAAPRFLLTRLAPTPSGYLHLGNVFSFALTAALAEESKAAMLLRIDDLDQERASEEYITDIFETLSFLDIPWDEPKNISDFNRGFTQKLRLPLYEASLKILADKGLLYACSCSRRLGRTCVNNCKARGLPLETSNVWRIRTDDHIQIAINAVSDRQLIPFPESMTDFVVRRRDGIPAYQLCSIVDDVHFGVDLVVRGADLLDSTLAQLFLARHLELRPFESCTFVHHRLLMDEKRQKLSKSKGDTSVLYLRRQGCSAAQVYAAMGSLAGVGPIGHWRELRHFSIREFLV